VGQRIQTFKLRQERETIFLSLLRSLCANSLCSHGCHRGLLSFRRSAAEKLSRDGREGGEGFFMDKNFDGSKINL
jgi:hypothetical protein